MENKSVNLHDTFDLDEIINYHEYTGIAKRRNKHETTSYLGCRFVTSKFTSIDMQNDDVIGCVFSDCDIQDVNFSDIDFSTNNITKSSLNLVKFDGATINCCEFGFSTINSCSFKHISLTNTSFRNCEFYNIQLDQTTTINNQFHNCEFVNCNLSSSVNYNLFNECEFQNTFVDKNVYSTNVYYSSSGENSFIPSIDYDLMCIENELRETQQFVPYAIYYFNHHYVDLESTFLACIAAIREYWNHQLIIRVEQIDFITLLLEFAPIINKTITAVTLYQSICILNPMIDGSQNNPNVVQSIRVALKHLYLTCIQHYNMKSMQDKGICSGYTSKLIKLDMVYDHKPSYELTTLLNETVAPEYRNSIYAKCLLQEHACFHEIIEMAVSMLPILEAIIALLGVTVPITVARIQAKSKKDSAENKSQQVINYNITNEITIQANSYLNNNFLLDSEGVVSTLIKNNITCENGYRGYTNENIRSIKITEDDQLDK